MAHRILGRHPAYFVSIAAVLFTAGIARAAVEYSATILGALPALSGTPSVGSAINASGQAVGSMINSLTPGSYGYMFDNGVATQIPSLPTPYEADSAATAINDDGQIVGWSAESNYYANYPVAEHAFLYGNGVVTDLGTLGGAYSAAFGVNDSGEIVGASSLSQGSQTVHAFSYLNGVMTDLGTFGGNESQANAVNDLGQIAGFASAPGGIAYAFLYSDGVMTNLGALGNTGSSALAINDEGEVVGLTSFDQSGTGFHAFAYLNGEMIDLGSLFGGYSQANAINDSGQIVGYLDAPSGVDGFIYSDGVMTDLNTLIDPVSEVSIYDAMGINNQGQIIGAGYVGGRSGNLEAILLTPIPEPSSMGLRSIGALAVIAIFRRPRRKPTPF